MIDPSYFALLALAGGLIARFDERMREREGESGKEK
jgi:hypothetical protein